MRQVVLLHSIGLELVLLLDCVHFGALVDDALVSLDHLFLNPVDLLGRALDLGANRVGVDLERREDLGELVEFVVAGIGGRTTCLGRWTTWFFVCR